MVLRKEIPILVYWLLTWYKSETNWDQVKRFVSILAGWITHRGLKWTVNHVKSMRNIVTRWACDQPIPDGTYSIRKRKDGFPKTISFMIPHDRNDIDQIRFVVSLLSILRCFEGLEEEDTRPIVDHSDSSLDDCLEVFSHNSVKRVVRSTGKSFFSIPKWKGKFHFSTKIGPNGHAMSSTAIDAVSLDDQIIENIKVVGGYDLHKRLMEYLHFIRSNIGPILCQATEARYPYIKGDIGKIVSIPAPEGKTRIIAQMDYWSQEALKPLHDFVMGVLKRIPNDLTFKQGKAPSVLYLEPGNSFWSIDLKSATDRFPIQFQELVLQSLFGAEYASAWVKIMRRPFKYGNEYLTYGSGQPMGSYSSWAVFTLCHHIIVDRAHAIARVNKYKTYAILGDDIVICNDRVAEEYLKILGKLGVEVSSHKTHKSVDSFEIAKRWYRVSGKVTEFTPFPFHSITETSSSMPLMLQALYEGTRKGWSVPNGLDLPSVAAGVSCLLKGNVSKGFFLHSLKVARVNWTVGEILRGYLEGVRGIRYLQGLFGVPLIAASSSVAPGKVPDSLLTNCVVELFSASADTKGQGIGDVGFNTVLIATNPDLVPTDIMQSLLDSTPQVSVYGAFEEQYLSIIGKVYDFDTIYSGSWDLAMRTLTVPDTSVVFSIRNKDVRTIFITKIAKALIDRLKTLAYSQYAL
nr:MAG: RNA-dependent RNA polymerase [Hangzhou mito-like virus 4]